MNRIVKLLILLAVSVLLTFNILASESETVVFLKDGGSGDSTYSSFADAYSAIGDSDGTIVVTGDYTVSAAFVAPSHSGKITITSVYNGVDYRVTSGAEIVIRANLYLGGETVIDAIAFNNQKSHGGIFAAYNDVTVGSDVICSYSGGQTTYPSFIGGTYNNIKNASGSVTINGGTWQRVRLGNSAGVPTNSNLDMTINGGTFVEFVALASSKNHTGDFTLTVNGGTFCRGIYGAAMSSDGDYTYSGSLNVAINGGTVYGQIAPKYDDIGTISGEWNVTLNGGDFSRTTEISGAACDGDSIVSTLNVGADVDIGEEIKGTYTFANPIRPNGADPWLFYHNGNYYYIATAGSVLTLYCAANIGDLATARGEVIYSPESGKEWSSDLWSPEIHYFSAEEIGEEYAGWYCFLGSQPDEEYLTANGLPTTATGFGYQRAYVIKCLDGDNLLGRWGNPLTGKVNVPQKIAFPDSDYNNTELTGGCSVITIDGVKYITFISEVGRETSNTDNFNFYQTINIAAFTNPWTIEGEPKVICVPEYDWEKGGSEDRKHPQVVEGATAVYGDDGEVFIIYSGSGYWTPQYCLAQLKFLGGDPTDINNWEKLPEPIFSKSDELNGCGHASYVTDTSGQGWVCYHAYIGTTTESGRYAFVEPYSVVDGNVVIADGTKQPAPIDTVYTASLNSTPIAEKIGGFDSIKYDFLLSITETEEGVWLNFNSIYGADEYNIICNGNYLVTVTENAYFMPLDMPGRYAYSVQAWGGGKRIVSSAAESIVYTAPLNFSDMNEDGRLGLDDVLLLIRKKLAGTVDAKLTDIIRLLRCL